MRSDLTKVATAALNDLPTADEVTPVRRGRFTLVRPVGPDDYEWLFRVALRTSAGSRWRMHGELPNIDQFLTTLFQGAKATCVIEEVASSAPCGMVQLWHYDPLSLHGQLTAFLTPEAEGKGWPLEGIFAFMSYAFSAYNLRKIYIESLEPEMRTYQSLVGSLMHQEGQLIQHQYVFGRWVDAYLFAVYRQEFEQFFRMLQGHS